MSKLSDFHRIQSLKDARHWLGFSLRQMATIVKPQGEQPQKHLSKATIAAWENPGNKRKPSPEQIRQIGVMIANELTKELGRTIGVMMRVNSPWHITAHAKCCDCRRWFRMKRDTSRRCGRCIKH